MSHSADDLLGDLRHPLVRDLAWCVFSPTLVSCPPGCAAETTDRDTGDSNFLLQLDRNPIKLERWVEHHARRRLGLRFECFWQFWLSFRYPQCTTEHRFNLQVRAAGRTLGELDCVSFDSIRQRLVHREMAVKFYLGVSSDQLAEDFRPDTGYCWVGANVSDRLDLKYTQMFERQMHLLDKPEARRSLPDAWQELPLEKRAIVRGRLFYPADGFASAEPHAPVAAGHLRGRWLPLHRYADETADAWCPLGRNQWFATLAPEPDRDVLSAPEMNKFLQQSLARVRQPLQVASLDRSGGLWRERERLFVVPDHWPATARPLCST